MTDIGRAVDRPRLGAQHHLVDQLFVLRAADLDVENIVSMRTYLLSRDDIPGFRAARDRVFGEVKPAGTLLIVAGLAVPDWRIEIDAFAYG